MGPIEQKIEQIITPILDDLGLDLVRVRLSGKKRMTLQIMIERANGDTIHIDECAKFSLEVSTLLDIDDPIQNPYALEVSSPGIDRPLTRKKDFATWAGFEAKVSLSVSQNGRKHFRGQLLGIEDDIVAIQNPDNTDETWRVPFVQIGSAKLMLNDALLEFSQKQHELYASALADGQT